MSYLAAKDGYLLNYCEPSENKKMLAAYNRYIRTIRKLRLIPTDEFEIIDFIVEDTPVYRYAPKSQEDVDSLKKVADEIGSSRADNIEIGKTYLLYFSDDLGEFYLHIMEKSEFDRDVIRLLKIQRFLERK